MPKFKVGDIIIGRPEADEHYTVTVNGWKGKVFEANSNGERILVSTVGEKEGRWWVEAKYFDLLEPAAEPAAEPTCKFKVGDKVICRGDAEWFSDGELGRIVEVDPNDDEYDIRVEKLKSDDDWWESSENFELYEEPAPEYKTEHRPAKVGEYVKILSEDGHHAKKGSILKVKTIVNKENWVRVIIKENDDTVLRYEQYDVVLNYGDPKPTYKTEHREANTGEYVVIVEPTDDMPANHNFKNGDICKVLSGGGSLVLAECVKGSNILSQSLRTANYDVLIDYDPSAASTEPSTTKPAASTTKKREHDKPRKVRVRFKKSKFKTLEGNKAYRKDRAQIDKLDGCTVIVIGDSGVLFDLDIGVLKVDLRHCELF